jgi:hypothetical protein
MSMTPPTDPEKRSTGDSGAITGHCRGEVLTRDDTEHGEEYVRATDYRELESENENLRNELNKENKPELLGTFADAFDPFAKIAVLESENERLRELLSEARPHLPQRFSDSLGCRVCELCDQGKSSSRQARENFVERQS